MSLAFLTVAVVLPILLNALDDKLHGTSGGGAAKTSDFEVPFLVRGQPDDDLMGTGARAPTEVSATNGKEHFRHCGRHRPGRPEGVGLRRHISNLDLQDSSRYSAHSWDLEHISRVAFY